MKKKIPQPLKNIYHWLIAFFSAAFFRFPGRKLTIVGVTGTDGKTTTVNLIYHILNYSGLPAGMISTLGAVVNNEQYETGFHVTTPSAYSIQKFLGRTVSQGVKYAVIETTSHALDQNRVAFVPFKIGVITNVTHEHLDYHKTYKNYLLAKAKILHGVKSRVLNSEDSSFEKLKMQGSGQLLSFGALGSDYFGEEINSFQGQTNYAIHYRTKQKQLKTLQISTHLEGDFNFSNILAAFAVSKALGLEDKKITAAISTFTGVEGRMEEVSKGQDFRVIIDFAHTPKALESILLAARKFTKNKIICVFGSASERDTAKRALMGQISARLADYTIITSEDPRKESPEKIIEDIAAGAIKTGALINKNYWKIRDRKEAISLSIKNLASEGDTVLILGKGHEKTMNIGGKEIPWSDKLEAETAIAVRLKHET